LLLERLLRARNQILNRNKRRWSAAGGPYTISSGRLRELEQASERQSRGKAEKREHEWVSLKEQRSRFEYCGNHDQKASPTRLSDDSKWPFKNSHGLDPRGGAALARDGLHFISSAASEATQSSQALHSDKQPRATFPPTIVYSSGRRQQRGRQRR
jgi:hypothetical protein